MRYLHLLCILFFLLTLTACGGGGGDKPPPDSDTTEESLTVGVLLPLSGAEDRGWQKPLEWALSNINAAGGVAGKKLKLKYSDTSVTNTVEAARQLASDPSVLAVIGPAFSREVMATAQTFIARKKVMVSPSATSADIFRAFGGERYIWRTVESDITQLLKMLTLAGQGGATSVSLLTSADPYGATFFNWFGFLADELHLEVKSVVQFDQSVNSCEDYMKEALTGSPDVLLAVPSNFETTLCMATTARELAPETRLIFSDGAMLPALIGSLGLEAEGLEGTIPSASLESGFEAAYEKEFSTASPPFAANLYDSLMLIAFGLERSEGKGGEELANAMAEIVQARGTKTDWTREGIASTLLMIKSNILPDISGASGTLEFDSKYLTDPVSTNYGHWRVEGGEFLLEDIQLSSEIAERASDVSKARWTASRENMLDLGQTGPELEFPEKTGLWALIVAGSSGWSNYRHQADALAQYNLLKANGVEDDHIILILADDIAYNEDNKEPGTMHYFENGPDLYQNVEIDYRISNINASDILDILSGNRTGALPFVIDSSPGDNIYVYLSGHGSSDGFFINSVENSLTANSATVITPSDLGRTINSMYTENRYRKMLIVVESCHGGVMGQDINSPGVILFSSASPTENSIADNYSKEYGIWYADQFSHQLWSRTFTDPDSSLKDLYEWLYLHVSGSHVSVYNRDNFGDLEFMALDDFFIP
jgi:glycosylphosphatidylinositol transamidase (GPIT) subunit GPI8/ABC-type branched-subunit amino acid transport system substrate-binding protein